MSKDTISDNFINNYILVGIKNILLKSLNSKNLAQYNKEFDIDVRDVLIKSVDTLIVTKVSSNTYIIQTNKNIKYKDNFLDNYLRLITYGSRTSRGYPILLNIFKFIEKNVYFLYRRWQDGDTLL